MGYNHLVGKKFKYNSKYGGLSDWTGTITHIFQSCDIIPFDERLVNRRIFNERWVVATDTPTFYYLDEIEIIYEP